MQKRYKSRPLATAVALTVLALGLSQPALHAETPALAAPPTQVGLPDFASIVRGNTTSVVHISVRNASEPTGSAHRLPNLPPDSPLNDLLRQFRIPQEQNPDTPPRNRGQSIGSGFVIAADGYILTSHHVVEDAKEIRVKLADRREFNATLVGGDPLSDVAVLKIDATGLPVVRIGDATRAEVGEWVLAIGAPFGLERTATQGIISAKGRSLPNDTYVPFLQTDVPINPGNSGGPLFNLRGEVIGINSQIYSKSGGYMGLSFAIPIDVAMNVATQIRESGTVTRGWLGITLQEVNHDLARSFNLDRPRGALVADVNPDGPARQGGLKAGDIIVAIDGSAVESSADLPPLVGATRPGTPITLRVIREGAEQALRVIAGTLPNAEETVIADASGASGSDALGLAVAELTPTQREELDVPSGGVLVMEVAPGPARDAGVRRGDVLLRLNGTDLRSVADLRAQLDKLPPGRPGALQIKRNGNPLFLALTVGKKPVG
ncbi:MAG: DegQ family serine endoprotease [Thiotrichales bacterium]